MIYISLLNNITLLVTLSVIHSLLLRYLGPGSKRFRALSGTLFGLVAVTGMLNSVELQPGVIFDGRSIILVTAGVFGGPVPVIIAMLISSSYRIFLGGAGTLMGVLVIIQSGFMGLLFNYLRKKLGWSPGLVHYFVLALVVHVNMLILAVFLPGQIASEVIPVIGMPVLTIYPVATLLLFILFARQEQYRKMVARLSDREAALMEANKIAGMGRWEHDLSTGRLEWSDTIFDIFEIDKGKFGASYDAFIEAVHPEDRSAVDTAYHRSLETRKPYEIEHRLLMKDGRVKFVLERCRTSYNDEGSPVKSVGIVQDITYREEARMALEESRKMLRLIIDSIPIRVFWKDNNSRYLGCNIPFARDAGFDSPDELAGLDDYQMGWIDQAELYRRDDRMVMETGKPKLNYEEPQTTPDGGRIWLKTNKVPLTDINGDIIGVLGTYEDITPGKKMEQELINARDRAEESDRLKTAFLNNLSHEIRTPLNAIVGFSELLDREETDKKDIEKYAGIIQHSSSQLLAIIDDIFDIAAIEAGQVRLLFKKTGIRTLLTRIIEQYQIQALENNNNLSLDIELTGSDQYLMTDETKLNQIICNLLNNALKFTRNGKIVVACRGEMDQLRLSVSDTGVGIPEELHGVIFDRFRQGTKDATGEYGGSGLGLFIAKSYAELLGGTIDLESSPGEGSVFIVTIPLKQPDSAAYTE
ncbi:MAG: PAS domain S-box protein [Marinilabiliales bacterium]|nr:MAG: PAS domain S-box protein [Marinilabiliales bacterium]